MKYKAIIFDLDDVICSTDEYHYLAWKALADRLGISFDRKRNNLLCWVSRMQSLEIIWKRAAKPIRRMKTLPLRKKRIKRTANFCVS